MLTKKNILVVSLTCVTLYVISLYPIELRICGHDDYGCRTLLESMQMVLGIFPVILLLSLVTYKMRDEVFESWKRLSYWFVPISILIILSTSNRGGGWGISLGNPQELLAIFLPGLYLILSLGVITWKWFALRKAK